MATVNLGRIKPTWQGTWNSGTQYVADDIVYYNNSAWVAVATSTNSAPADGNANWELMAQGSDIPGNATTGQILTATGASTFAWDDLPPSDDASALTTGTLSADRMGSGTVVQVQTMYYTGVTSNNTTSWSSTGVYGTITPKYADSKILIEVHIGSGASAANNNSAFQVRRGSTQIGGSTNSYCFPGTWCGSDDYTSTQLAHLSASYLDSPNTTSAINYTIYAASNSTSNTVYIGRPGGGTGTNSAEFGVGHTTMILTEIRP